MRAGLVVHNERRLPGFLRISWVSARAGSVWEPRLTRAAERAVALRRAALESGALPLALEYGTYHGLDERGAELRLRGLALLRMDDMAPPAAHQPPGAEPDDGRHAFALAGDPVRAEEAGRCLAQGDAAGYYAAFGVPGCCADSLVEAARTGLDRSVLPLILPDDSYGEYARNSMLLEQSGLNILPYHPCSLACEASRRIAGAILAAGDGDGDREASLWLTEALTWPVEWSCLHGIREIKTPVFRCIADCLPVAGKHTVRYHGSGYPAEGAQGVLFPYLRPEAIR